MSSDVPRSTADCLPEESLHAVLAGGANPLDSAHLAACGACQAALRRLQAEATVLQYSRTHFAAQHAEELPLAEAPAAIGKYIIVGRWDDGPVWTTYRGLHAVVHREVLVQVARTSLADETADSTALAAAARPWMTRQPHVAMVLDVGVHGDRPYLVVEYDGGLRLDRRPVEDGSPAHARGIASIAQVLGKFPTLPHPDLRPASLVVEDDGRLTLVDWAAANLWAAASPQSQFTAPAVRSLARIYADWAGAEPLPDVIIQALEIEKSPPSLEELADGISGKRASSLFRRFFGP